MTINRSREAEYFLFLISFANCAQIPLPEFKDRSSSQEDRQRMHVLDGIILSIWPFPFHSSRDGQGLSRER
jgi:hypothetical protein